MGKSNVVPFTGQTTNDISVEAVLNGSMVSLDEDEPMLVIGCEADKEDTLYFASSVGGTAELLLLLERAKQMLMDY